jgi:hypothetical protein
MTQQYPSQAWEQPSRRSKPSRKKLWLTIAGVLVGLFVLLTVLVAIFRAFNGHGDT